MVNNRENILNCIHLTDDINLIMLHRSLFILKKKFEQNKEGLKNLYKKYGEYLDKEEELLIDENYLPKLLKEIFNLNKFEISYVNNFKEAMFKEMDYCKEINIEEYIFNEFIEFIKSNRKRYNFIFREKRNNTVFNLENYEQFELNIVDDLTKEVKIDIIDEDEYENDDIFKNDKRVKISSAKYKNKLFLEDVKPPNIKLNLNLIKKKHNTIESNEDDKDNTYSYSESEVGIFNKKDYSGPGTNRGGKNIGEKKMNEESGNNTHRSNINGKGKNEENNENNIIVENEDEEKESNNKIKNDDNENDEEKVSINNEVNKENENDDENKDNQEKSINSDKNNELNENNNLKNPQLLFSSNKKKTEYVDKVFYNTIYDREKNNIKSITYLKHYLYIDIIPLIIADFISDERNLYLILDHSDDFRNNLSTIFDVEILFKLGKNSLEEVLNQRISKISDLKKNKLKVEKNIENYEKLLEKMKNQNQNVTYIIITIQKLKDFLNWLNTKIHVLQNDIIIYKEYEKNINEKEKLLNSNMNSNNNFNKNKKGKKQEIMDNYKQLKRDFEIRKFILQKRKILNTNNKKKLKPINKNNSKEVNNSNNISNNNISNIENENSNNNIDSGEMSEEDYNNSFLLSENNMSNKKKPKFYYPKVKKLNFKNSYDDIMIEKKVNDEDGELSKSSNNDKNIEKGKKNKNIQSNKKYILKNKKINENDNIKNIKIDEIKENKEEIQNNINEEIDENNIYKNLKLDNDNNYERDNQIENNNNESNNNINNIVEENNVETNNNENNNINDNEIIKTNKSQRINNKIKKNKKSQNYNNNNINTNFNINSEKKINKKVRYILKKIEQPKNLSKDEKREIAIKEIFNYYSSKNVIIENKSSTFDKIQTKTGHLSLNEYCRFCNDFKIPLTKDKIFALFNKSTSLSSKIMTFQEFKISLISMSFAINDFRIEEINRSINIFIGKAKIKNKDRSRFEKYNEKEMKQNKEIIQEKMKEIDEIQKKNEDEIIEEFFQFLEIDDVNKYRPKMKGIYNANKINEISLPKIKVKENILINNKKNEYSKSNAILTYNKKNNDNSIPKLKKINIGKQFWIKDMIEKKKPDTPKRERIVIESEESNEDEEKDNNLPVIESSGIPLFSKNKKLENKYFDN